jgi:O-methyltransferase
MSLEAIAINSFYSRFLKYVNDRVFLQFRPTFCRVGNPKVASEVLYDSLRKDWKINDRGDIVRYYFLYLQLKRIEEQSIPGDFAELGVYKGNTALFFNRVIPHRTLHLFDTFEGFSDRDSKKFATSDDFKDVRVEDVKSHFPDSVRFYVGYFPETAAALDRSARFALVHIDMDLEGPISAALDFFYPLVNPGGVIIVHDYNNTGSWERGAKKAVDRFLAGKPETGIEMPDRYGSIVIAKSGC